jgi:hypothetical protein
MGESPSPMGSPGAQFSASADAGSALASAESPRHLGDSFPVPPRGGDRVRVPGLVGTAGPREGGHLLPAVFLQHNLLAGGAVGAENIGFVADVTPEAQAVLEKPWLTASRAVA